MTSLSHNHKRRILTSLQYADKQLDASLQALSPAAQPLFSGYIQDLSPAQARWVECYAAKIRGQMSKLLDRCGIEIPAPSTSAMGRIRTSITSLDLTLEDIHPEKLGGYGKIDRAAAAELSWTLQETRGLVNWLLAFLSETAVMELGDLGPAGTRPALAALCKRLVEIVTDHGLVEFLPALRAIYRTSRAHNCTVAVFGKSRSGKSSLINRLIGLDLLSLEASPWLGLPVRVESGDEAGLRITFPDHAETVPVARFAEFAGEQENPRNSKRVVTLEILAPSIRLRKGLAFVEEPYGGAFRLSGGVRSDVHLALLLVDATSPIGGEEAGLLRALAAVPVRTCVMLTMCDRLSSHEVQRKREEVYAALTTHLTTVPEVIPTGLGDSWMTALYAWFEAAVAPIEQRSLAALTDSVETKARSLAKAILTALETKPEDSYSGDAERILRHLDEKVAAFQRRWENEIDAMAGWAKSILDHAATGLAGESADASQSLALAISAPCSVFTQEYDGLRSEISSGIADLRPHTDPNLILGWEIPRPDEAPLPLFSMLRGMSVQPPGTLARINPAAGSRHYRKELEEKAGDRLRRTLDELQPRVRYWFAATMNSLRESLRMQTDPLRYRVPPDACNGGEKLASDIAFLRTV